jgi:hypothetical protein
MYHSSYARQVCSYSRRRTSPNRISSRFITDLNLELPQITQEYQERVSEEISEEAVEEGIAYTHEISSPVNIIFNTFLSSILLHIHAKASRSVFLLLMQEINRDIIYFTVHMNCLPQLNR